MAWKGNSPTSAQQGLQPGIQRVPSSSGAGYPTSNTLYNYPVPLTSGARSAPVPPPGNRSFPAPTLGLNNTRDGASCGRPPVTPTFNPQTAARPRTGTDFSQFALQAESDDESDVCNQLLNSQLNLPEVAAGPTKADLAPQLPDGGRHDDLLLTPGRAAELLSALAEEFKNDPPVNTGRFKDKCGLFHNQMGVYGTKVFSPSAVQQMLLLTHEWYADAPNVIRLSPPADGRLIVVGDTHGHLEDVLWLFLKYGVPSSKNQYLFDGDVVDRGGHGLDELLVLYAFKRDDVDSVHFLRGNHEDFLTSGMYGGKAEFESKFPQQNLGGYLFHWTCHEIFPLWPLCAIVSDSDADKNFSVMVVHGGVPVPGDGTNAITIEQINRLNRKVASTQLSVSRQTPEDKLLFNMLWSDPRDGPPPPGPRGVSRDGRGSPFFELDTKLFCQANGIRCVLRAHQPPANKAGFAFTHGNYVVTVFSASNYCGHTSNKGGVIICDGNDFSTIGLAPSEHWAPKWPELAEIIKSHGFSGGSAEGALAREIEGFEKKYGVAPLTNAASPNSSTAPASNSPTSAGKQVATQVKKEANDAAFVQAEHHIIKQIVWSKSQLYQIYCKEDPQRSGVLNLSKWMEVMARELGMDGIWDHVARKWFLADQVEYVRLLHRFQIVPMRPDITRSNQVDVIGALSNLRLQISDTRAAHLLETLDADRSGDVSVDEFKLFLEDWGVSMPPGQCNAVYEALTSYIRKNFRRSPTAEDIVCAISMISRGREAGSKDWTTISTKIGRELSRKGSLVQTFKSWDGAGNCDGYLTLDELQSGLLKDSTIGQQLNEDQLRSFMMHIDNQGVGNDRVSLIEFLRAVGEPDMRTQLMSSLLGEILKPCYFFKAALLSTLTSSFDPYGTNVVQVDEFKASLLSLNAQMESKGQEALTENQADAVSEIASNGEDTVQYQRFLNSLQAMDTWTMQRKASVGQQVMSAAFAGWQTPKQGPVGGERGSVLQATPTLASVKKPVGDPGERYVLPASAPGLPVRA